MCPNCGDFHVEIRCPHPEVARDKRQCWTCKGTGHSSKDCPKKAKRPPGAVRSVAEEEPLLLQAVSSGDFAPARRTVRPTPRPATLGDFLSKNTFAELASKPSQHGDPRRASIGPDAAPRRGVVSHPPSPGYDSITSATTRRSSAISRTSRIDANQATAKAYGETGGRRATTVDNDDDNHHNHNDDGHDVRLVGPSNDATPAKAKCRDVRGGVAPPADEPSPGETSRGGRICMTDFATMLHMEYQNAEKILAAEQRVIQTIGYDDEDDSDDDLMQVTTCPRVIEVAMDSGSVDHVMHPDELPEDVVCEPNTTGRHFKGAGASGSHITNFGSARTRLKDDQTGRVAECKWSLADVARPLHSAVKITGTIEHPKQDILFCAGKCVVVPAGTVDRVLKAGVKPSLQYDRKGDLFVAKLTMSSFARPGAK